LASATVGGGTVARGWPRFRLPTRI
jgi:hypothetical protein